MPFFDSDDELGDCRFALARRMPTEDADGCRLKTRQDDTVSPCALDLFFRKHNLAAGRTICASSLAAFPIQNEFQRTTAANPFFFIFSDPTRSSKLSSS